MKIILSQAKDAENWYMNPPLIHRYYADGGDGLGCTWWTYTVNVRRYQGMVQQCIMDYLR